MNQPQILKDLYKSKNPEQILGLLKGLNYKDASKKISQAVKHPFVRALIVNKKLNLPSQISDLRLGRILPDSRNFEGELAWLVQGILNNSKTINYFVELEREFETNILLEKYERAEVILKKIETEICISYWTIENRFSLYEKQYGTEKNWDYLKEINKNSENAYTLMYAYFTSKKVEKETSVLQYQRDLELLTNNIGKPESQYLLFKLGYLFYDNYDELSAIINIESISTVIDRYLILINILIELIDKEDNRELVKSVLDDLLSNKFIDKRINRLLESYNFVDTLSDFDNRIMKMYEIYSIGKYQECLNTSKELLKELPGTIEIYEIYSRCLIELDSEFVPTNISSIIDEIILYIYYSLTKESEYNNSHEVLQKLYLSFSNLNFFKQLLSLNYMFSPSRHNRKLEQYYFIFSYYSNPQLILFSNLHEKINYEEGLINKFLAIRINNSIAKNNIDLLLDIPEIPRHKLLIYKARIGYYYKEDSDIEFLKNLLKNPDLKTYLIEEVIICLFSAYSYNKSWDKMVQLVVDSYFKNKYFIERLDIQFLVKYIIENNYNLDETTIDLPILFYIENVDSYFLYASLEQYLDTLQINKPSEIEIDPNNTKLIFLLEKICSTAVLNNFYLVYSSDDEVIEERIQILRNLSEANESKKDIYIEEIKSLIQKQKISKTIKTVNDGKISLNFTRIKDDKEYSIENSFNRYLKLRQFSEKNDLSTLELSDFIRLFVNENSINQKPQDAGYVAFKSLFFEIVEHFLFSKEHGLDGDLSTRIRHGVLENQLRNVFSNYNLIATKGSDDSYKNIGYWKNLCEDNLVSKELHNKLQIALKDFSKSIDNHISKIVKEYIQIQSNRHINKPNAFFNYRYTEEYLYALYEQSQEITEYDDFLNDIFDFLGSHTELLLKNISAAFQNEINTQFQIIIDSLEITVKRLFGEKTEILIPLNQHIHRVKTQIETELYSVSNWFKLSNNSNYTELDMETIIHTAIASINLFKTNRIKPNLDLKTEELYTNGLYYVDIFQILINNCIKRSMLDISKLKIDISVINEIVKSNDDNSHISKTTISITNNLSKEIDKVELNNKLLEISGNWKSDLSSVNKEGGSGFHKIKRLLKYDIQVIDSSMNYELHKDKLSVTINITNPHITNE